LGFAGIVGWTLLAVSSFIRAMRPVRSDGPGNG
jgi:hypothetical protein